MSMAGGTPAPTAHFPAAHCHPPVSVPPRAVLDGKENELKVVLEELESERGKGQALQAQQEEQQLRFLQREGQNSRALEVTAFPLPPCGGRLTQRGFRTKEGYSTFIDFIFEFKK